MEKKIPIRRCTGCNQQKPKSDLLRIVKSKDENIEIDFTGKKNGRGAYICKSRECFKRIKKSKRLDRNLSISISEDIYNALENICNE